MTQTALVCDILYVAYFHFGHCWVCYAFA